MSALGLLMFALAQPATGGVTTSDTGGIGSVPAASTEILDAIGDCRAVVGRQGKVDLAKLKAAGWQFGGRQLVPARGPMPPLQQLFFGKGNVINVIQSTGISASCRTLATVTDPAASERELRAGLASRFGAVAAKDYPGDALYKTGLQRMAPGSLDKMMISDANRFAIDATTKDGKSRLQILMTPKAIDQ